MEIVQTTGLKSLRLGVAVLAAVGGLVLFLFDPSRFHFYPVCVFHQATGLLCPGCGGLRALHQLLHGHLYTAFRFNPLVVAAVPFLVGWCGYLTLRRPADPSRPISGKAIWYWVVPFLMLSLFFTVWRNLPGSLLAMFPG